MKLTVEEMKKLISDDDIHQAFLEREDIAVLSPDNQEKRWQEALESINKLRQWLSTFDTHIIWPTGQEETQTKECQTSSRFGKRGPGAP